MDAWASFWGWFLVAVLVVFGLLAVVITIGGFADARALFSSIDKKHDEEQDD